MFCVFFLLFVIINIIYLILSDQSIVLILLKNVSFLKFQNTLDKRIKPALFEIMSL